MLKLLPLLNTVGTSIVIANAAALADHCRAAIAAAVLNRHIANMARRHVRDMSPTTTCRRHCREKKGADTGEIADMSARHETTCRRHVGSSDGVAQGSRHDMADICN